MAKTKKSIIKQIKTIIRAFEPFGSGEVEPSNSPLVSGMGDLIALAEYFNYKSVEVRVYDSGSMSSDSIHDYEVEYENLSKDVLEEILFVAEQYEAEQIKTAKRISN
jgi:hypothetical protein